MIDLGRIWKLRFDYFVGTECFFLVVVVSGSFLFLFVQFCFVEIGMLGVSETRFSNEGLAEEKLFAGRDYDDIWLCFIFCGCPRGHFL